MYTKFISVFFLSMCLLSCNEREATQAWDISSPDGNLSIQVSLDSGQVFYSILLNTDTVIGRSAMGICGAGFSFENDLRFVKSSAREIKENYTLLIGKRKENSHHGREKTLTFQNVGGEQVDMVFRAYDNAVAFKYSIEKPGDTIVVTNESTVFSIPQNGKAWLQPYGEAGPWGPSYEEMYRSEVQIGEHAPTGGWSFPALFKGENHWVLLTEAGLTENFYGSHLGEDCTNGKYRITGPLEGEAMSRYTTSAISIDSISTPWRTVLVGRELGAIVESNIVYALAEPNQIGDISWIQPGKSSWSWWSDHSSSKDFSSLKEYIDLSAEMGWKYSLVDANWDLMEGGDIRQLIEYANGKNVDLTLWYNSGGPHNTVTERPRDVMSDPERRKSEFKKLHKWGIKAVKVDFFNSDKQEIIKLYLDILKDAAAEKILVDFHGSTIPRGWSRTYPNLMTMEAVKGGEQYGWDKKFAEAAPAHNITVMFTRNVIGPVDFTPLTFSSYECCAHTTTNAYELATAVLFESGIQHFADKAQVYRDLDEDIKRFLSDVPVVWDDTRFIAGEPDKLMVMARQKGNEWYVAGANGENKDKTIDLDLSFMSDGDYRLHLFKDGLDSREIVVEKVEYVGGKISINMLGNGGFTILASPVPN